MSDIVQLMEQDAVVEPAVFMAGHNFVCLFKITDIFLYTIADSFFVLFFFLFCFLFCILLLLNSTS